MICLQSIEKHPAFILRGNLRVGEQDSRNDSGVHIPEIRLEARAMVVDKLHAEPLSAIDRIFQTGRCDQDTPRRGGWIARTLHLIRRGGLALRLLLGALRRPLALPLTLCGRLALGRLLGVLRRPLALPLALCGRLALGRILLSVLRRPLTLPLALRGRLALGRILLGVLRRPLTLPLTLRGHLALGLSGRPASLF